MDKPSNKHWTLCIYAALVLSTLAAYWQVRSHEFVNYDDDDYVVANRQVHAAANEARRRRAGAIVPLRKPSYLRVLVHQQTQDVSPSYPMMLAGSFLLRIPTHRLTG